VDQVLYIVAYEGLKDSFFYEEKESQHANLYCIPPKRPKLNTPKDNLAWSNSDNKTSQHLLDI